MTIQAVVDRDSQQKLYVQIYGIIKRKIEHGDWLVSALIPSEDELCRIFNVSKATVRLAVADLVKDGYLKRQQGKGTFVKSSVPHLGMTILTRFSEDVFGSGVRLDREIILRTVTEPAGEAARYMRFGGPVLHIRCRGAVSGEPTCVEDLFASVSLVPGIEDADLSKNAFFEAIQERAPRKIAKVIQTIDIVKTKGDTASYLGMKDGAPSVGIYRMFIDAEDVPLAFTKLVGKVGRYKVQNEFERVR